MSPAQPTHLLQPGDLLNGRWEIQSHIATGGKGEVYRARQLKLDRDVAVKIVSRELIAAYEDDEEEIISEMARFRREVLAMARTRHANVLQVYDHEETTLVRDGEDIPLEYLVMEYVDGPTLSDTIPASGLAQDPGALAAWTRAYLLPVLDGVEHIHAQGIVHRDLKPSNVLLDQGVPKITDFGLVGGNLWQPLTRSHHVMGTLAYMAPEQYLELGGAGPAADIYSLGKMLYRAAVGTLDKETMLPLKTAGLPAPVEPDLVPLDQVIRRATAEEPGERHASVEELRRDLTNALARIDPAAATDRPPAPHHGRWWAAAAVVLALLLAAGVWYHFHPQGQGAATPSAPGAAPAAPAVTAGGSDSTGPPQATLKGRDQATMRLIPRGEGRQDGSAAPFYLDETPVTNHQYVEFLNAVRDGLEVKEGVVRGRGKVWLRLGEVKKGLAPIAYRQGRFVITEPTLATHPVVSVSALGAAAYASHFGKRLPTRSEWQRALRAGADPAAPEEGATAGDGHAGMASMHGESSGRNPETPGGYAPVQDLQADRLGLRGMGAGLGEWVVRDQAPASYLVLESPTGEPAAGPIPPWRVFNWVGFRCAFDAS